MFIYRLVTTVGSKLFFLSRPRRFGKSLMISTFKAMFEGRRELFKGLDIMNTDWDWKKKYPVIHFEFNDLTVTSIEEFGRDLVAHIVKKLGDASYAYDKS